MSKALKATDMLEMAVEMAIYAGKEKTTEILLLEGYLLPDIEEFIEYCWDVRCPNLHS